MLYYISPRPNTLYLYVAVLPLVFPPAGLAQLSTNGDEAGAGSHQTQLSADGDAKAGAGAHAMPCSCRCSCHDMGLNCWLAALMVPSCLPRLLRLVLTLQLEEWGNFSLGRPGPTTTTAGLARLAPHGRAGPAADAAGLARLARLAPCGRAGRAGPAVQGRKNNWKLEVTNDW